MSKKKDNIINFPKGKIIKVDNTAGIAREHILFTEDLTQGLVVNMIHNMSENGIDYADISTFCPIGLRGSTDCPLLL